MAISSRAAACTALGFPSTTAAAPPSSVSVNRRAQPRKAVAAVARATSAGGAVLDPPAFDQSQLDTLPPAQEGAHSATTPNQNQIIVSSSPFLMLGALILTLRCAVACRRRHGEAQGPQGHRQRRQLQGAAPRRPAPHREAR
uniref:Uncharacterized protein n=1 Tax=Aegilops tauschii subsp. strangulata TaxID=200361 RepID=A0A453FV86_AEGTS